MIYIYVSRRKVRYAVLIEIQTVRKREKCGVRGKKGKWFGKVGKVKVKV